MTDNIIKLPYTAQEIQTFMSQQAKFIPKNTVIHVELDGSGDFTDIQSAINSLEDRYSNGTVIIEIGEGIFSVDNSIYINGEVFNIPQIIIRGKGSDKTIIRTTVAGDYSRGFNIQHTRYLHLQGFKVEMIVNDSTNRAILAEGNSNIILGDVEVTQTSGKGESGIYATAGTSVLIGILKVSNFSHCITAEASVVQSYWGCTLDFSNADYAFWLNSGSIIGIQMQHRHFDNVSSIYNTTASSYKGLFNMDAQL